MYITDILNSKSKFICLRTIVAFGEPIHLRRIANLSGLQVRSIQLALRSLEELNVLKTRKNKNRIEYFMNTKSPLVSRLSHLLENPDLTEVRNGDGYKFKFSSSLKFIDETKHLMHSLKAPQ